MKRELALQTLDQRTIFVVDRTLAAEMIIMLGDLEHPLAGNIAAM